MDIYGDASSLFLTGFHRYMFLKRTKSLTAMLKDTLVLLERLVVLWTFGLIEELPH